MESYVIQGNTFDVLQNWRDEAPQMVFVDPPYEIKTDGPLMRPDASVVDSMDRDKNRIVGFDDYDQFTLSWLDLTLQVADKDATFWVMGTYHNIFRIGAHMQRLGFWILNTVTWVKPNAMPNFNGKRLKNDIELIIWAKPSRRSRYTFHYQDMKADNGGKQMGSAWRIPTCGGSERLRFPDGTRLHPTQKPEKLLQRIIRMSTNPEDLILDPFAGTGTTAAVAKQLGRRCIGIEYNETYATAANERLQNTPLGLDMPTRSTTNARIAFDVLLQMNLLRVGQVLYLRDSRHTATIQADGTLISHGFIGSIHGVAAKLKGLPACNGWKHWEYLDTTIGERQRIDVLRTEARQRLKKEDDNATDTRSP